MKALPILDLALSRGNARDQQDFRDALQFACRNTGFFYLINHGISPGLTRAVLAQSKLFFDLEESLKNRIHIRHSTNFRGYSQMKNERDWREQVHFGLEGPATTFGQNTPECYRLTGENQWPEALGDPFRATMLQYMEAMHQLGRELLSAIAITLELPTDYFEKLSEEPSYLLMKLICYYAQPNTVVDRPGVAPHCDWSWLTILLQDKTGGLEILSPDEQWDPVTPAAGMLSVNLGELMEILSKGQYVATAHRVINPSEEKRRISIPVFINPALNAEVIPHSAMTAESKKTPGEHIHRVVKQGAEIIGFNFGTSEWARKGEGKWCYNAGCL